MYDDVVRSLLNISLSLSVASSNKWAGRNGPFRNGQAGEVQMRLSTSFFLLLGGAGSMRREALAHEQGEASPGAAATGTKSTTSSAPPQSILTSNQVNLQRSTCRDLDMIDTRSL